MSGVSSEVVLLQKRYWKIFNTGLNRVTITGNIFRSWNALLVLSTAAQVLTMTGFIIIVPPLDS